MLLGGVPNHQTTPINETNMSKKRHTKEAQIKAIRDHESGRSQAEVCKELNITAQTLYRWKKQLGMMTGIATVCWSSVAHFRGGRKLARYRLVCRRTPVLIEQP